MLLSADNNYLEKSNWVQIIVFRRFFLTKCIDVLSLREEKKVILNTVSIAFDWQPISNLHILQLQETSPEHDAAAEGATAAAG